MPKKFNHFYYQNHVKKKKEKKFNELNSLTYNTTFPKKSYYSYELK